MDTEPIAGKSYYIEPTGRLHEVADCGHRVFAECIIKERHQDLLDEFIKNKPSLYVSDVCKDILTGMLGWITYTPLGTNTNVGYVGRKASGEITVFRFSRHQIKALYKLWDINGNRHEQLEEIIRTNNLEI